MDPKVIEGAILRMQARKWDLPEGSCVNAARSEKYEKARRDAMELKCDLKGYANDAVGGLKAQLLQEAAEHAEKAQAAIDAIRFLAQSGVI